LLGEKKRQPVNIGIGQRLRHQRHLPTPGVSGVITPITAAKRQ
jgi:hypothetical protein